jgi:hypothetical protein
MGDSGEGLIDTAGRIQERMEELERERAQKHGLETRDPELLRTLESLRLARTDIERRLNAATHPARKAQLMQALEEIDRRTAEARKTP